ncbi:MAG: hypothetical protein JNJ56_04990, partial [Ignavibacteria bacterium]|nr:hypothetical protein [Ignavibacteria bacterium]
GFPLSESSYVRIVVKDNGIGFDEKYAEKIFNIFQRLQGRAEYEGTGIGLDIVNRIIKRHNGEIKVTSVPGKTEFTVIIPATAEQNKNSFKN